MSIFDRHLTERSNLATTLAGAALESNNATIDNVVNAHDPLGRSEDAFASQRAALNQAMGLESLVSADLAQADATQEVTQEAEQTDASQEATQDTSQEVIQAPTQEAAAQEAPPTQEAEQSADQSATTQEVTQEASQEETQNTVLTTESQVGTLQEVTQVNEPVDGANDDLTIVPTDTDVELPKGTFTAELGDNDDSVIDVDADYLDDDANEADYLENEMRMLMSSAIAIESYGINPTAMAILQTTGLLNSTALESLGLEAFGFQAPSHPESQLAMEALTDKLKATAAKWSAKVMNVVSSSGEKVMSVLTPLWEKVSGMVKTIGGRTWDSAKAAGATVKVHPYKTVIAVIAAIGAVAAIVALCVSGAPAPGAKIDAMKAFINRIVGEIGKIKWPFGTVKASAGGVGGQKLIVEFSRGSALVEAGKLAEKGWTATAVKAMGSQLNRAIDGIKHAWTAFGDRSVKLAKSAVSATYDFGIKPGLGGGRVAGKIVEEGLVKRGVGHTASEIMGNAVGHNVTNAYLAGFLTLIVGLFKLTMLIVVGGVRLIKSTLSLIMPHSEPATA